MNPLETLTAGFDSSVDDEGDRAHTENTKSAGEENSQENPHKHFSEMKNSISDQHSINGFCNFSKSDACNTLTMGRLSGICHCSICP